jgi:hypothetical protein
MKNDWLTLLLNILKLGGVTVTSVAGIVATLTETKKEDKRSLTKGGNSF